MSLIVTYDGTTYLTAAYGLPPSAISVPTRAENGDSGSGVLPFEDPAAALTLAGHKPVIVEEDECAQPRIFTGYVTERGFARSGEDGLIVGDDRLVEVNVYDQNAAAHFIIIGGDDGNRPQETWNARLAWLVASDYLAPFIGGDTTYFGSYTQSMDAADYRNGYAASVLDDLSERTGGVLNWFLFWNPDTTAVELFIKREEYTTGLSTLSISNVESDVDGVTVFAPDMLAKLAREPDQVYSEVIVQYGDGQQVYRSLESTALTYTRRGTTISRPYTKRESTAIAQADQWLAAHATERDRITCVMRSVPADSVGLVRAGMGIAVRMSHMPGYEAEGGVEMRIVMCSPVPVSDLGDLYDISLELLGARPSPEGCPDPTPSGTYYPLGWRVPHDGAWAGPTPAHGCVFYSANGSQTPYIPTPGSNTNIWNFPQYGSDGGGIGTEDKAGACVVNWLRIVGVGPGTLTINTTAHGAGDGRTPIIADVYDIDPDDPGAFNGSGGEYFLTRYSGMMSGDTVVIPIPTTLHCNWLVQLTDYTPVPPGSDCTKGYGWTSAVWDAGESPTGDPIPTPIHPTTTVTDEPPTADDDESIGFSVGDHWVDTDTGTEYVLVDATDGAAVWVITGPPTAAGAPTTADYLVGTAQAGLSAEIVVGTTPGGELGGTWASPTVDATHAGSTHVALADSVTDETTWGIAPADGSAGTASRSDHTHGSPAAPPGEMLVADGTSGPDGITPTSYVEEEDAHTTTSATLEDIPDVTTTITLQRSSHVAAWLNTQISGSGVCVIGIAVNFDGTDHDEMQHAISGSDAAALAVVHRTATELAPGTYTIKGRMRRVSGASTPSVDRADLLVMAMGHSGPVLLTNDDEDDYLYADL